MLFLDLQESLSRSTNSFSILEASNYGLKGSFRPTVEHVNFMQDSKQSLEQRLRHQTIWLESVYDSYGD